jgi:hypothetical protein
MNCQPGTRSLMVFKPSCFLKLPYLHKKRRKIESETSMVFMNWLIAVCKYTRLSEHAKPLATFSLKDCPSSPLINCTALNSPISVGGELVWN